MTCSPDTADTRTCFSCVHFVDDPGAIEAEFPGIPVFGSAFASCRGHAGMCQARERFMDPILATSCPSFEARDDRPTTR
jgi:hypothetical protein